MITKKVTLRQAQNLCRKRKAEGKWFGVSVIKKTDGVLRRMCARGGVKAGVTGVGLKFDPATKRVLGIWDRAKKDFRFINLDGIVEVRTKGIRYVVK